MYFLVLNAKTKHVDIINSKDSNEKLFKGIVGDKPQAVKELLDWVKEQEKRQAHGACIAGDDIAIMACDLIWEQLIQK